MLYAYFKRVQNDDVHESQDRWHKPVPIHFLKNKTRMLTRENFKWLEHFLRLYSEHWGARLIFNKGMRIKFLCKSE